MPRDYKKEWEKEKETKVTRLIKIDKELFTEFSEKLKKYIEKAPLRRHTERSR